MNKQEVIKRLKDNGIYQLNKGETLKDAIDYLDGKIPRKGYKYLHSNGKPMSENQQIAHANKEAFSKMVAPKEYRPDEVEDIDDICEKNDLRQDRNHRGAIANCYYCGWCVRVDGDEDDDYSISEPEIHCDDCMNNAISNLAM